LIDNSNKILDFGKSELGLAIRQIFNWPPSFFRLFFFFAAAAGAVQDLQLSSGGAPLDGGVDEFGWNLVGWRRSDKSFMMEIYLVKVGIPLFRNS
jgi:hypothetical protein